MLIVEGMDSELFISAATIHGINLAIDGKSHDSANGPFLTIKEGRERGVQDSAIMFFCLCEAEPKNTMAR